MNNVACAHRELAHHLARALHCITCVLSHVQLFVTPWPVAHQAPLSMGFDRQEYYSGLPFPSRGDFPDPGIEPKLPALQADSLPLEPQWKESTCQCRRHKRHGFNPWDGKIPGGGHGNPSQYSCMDNSTGTGAWWATIHEGTKSQTRMSN